MQQSKNEQQGPGRVWAGGAAPQDAGGTGAAKEQEVHAAQVCQRAGRRLEQLPQQAGERCNLFA